MSASASAIEPSPRERRAFGWRKIHSLTGVFPVGVFLVHHLWINAQALQGRAAYSAAVARAEPAHQLLIEVFAIGLPLAFHAIAGLVLSLEARPRLRAASGPGLTSYLLQRITGVVVLAFVIWHVGELRVPVWQGRLDPADHFSGLCSLLSATTGGVPWRAILYLVGLAAVAYHFANGLRGFCLGWGIVTSRRALRRAGRVTALFGLALFLLGASTVIYFATGLRLAADARPPSPFTESACADCAPDPAPPPAALPPTTLAPTTRLPNPAPSGSAR